MWIISVAFPIDEIDKWYAKLAELGFNSVRLITNWESIQPFQAGECSGERYSEECFDLEYLAYYETLIDRAQKHGIYVLIDMHQDIFSRHLFNYYNETPDYTVDGVRKVRNWAPSIDLYSLFFRHLPIG